MHIVEMLGYFLLYHSGRTGDCMSAIINYYQDKKWQKPYTAKSRVDASAKLDALLRNKKVKSITLSVYDQFGLRCETF